MGEEKSRVVMVGAGHGAGMAAANLRQYGFAGPITLIAQFCIDADAALIARDEDYRHFARWCGLKLAA